MPSIAGPTENGTSAFEIDAWDLGIGGLQDIDGQDMRQNGTSFPSRIINGTSLEVRIEVRSARIRAFWNNRQVLDINTQGRRLTPTPIWAMPTINQLVIGSWESPTLSESIELRRVAD